MHHETAGCGLDGAEHSMPSVRRRSGTLDGVPPFGMFQNRDPGAPRTRKQFLAFLRARRVSRPRGQVLVLDEKRAAGTLAPPHAVVKRPASSTQRAPNRDDLASPRHFDELLAAAGRITAPNSRTRFAVRSPAVDARGTERRDCSKGCSTTRSGSHGAPLRSFSRRIPCRADADAGHCHEACSRPAARLVSGYRKQ